MRGQGKGIKRNFRGGIKPPLFFRVASCCIGLRRLAPFFKEKILKVI